jgi:hypothetical protein
MRVESVAGPDFDPAHAENGNGRQRGARCPNFAQGRIKTGRDGGIRTHDLLTPSQAR